MPLLPKGVEVLSARRPFRAHLQPIGADPVERPEEAVETGKDPKMVLGEQNCFLVEAVNLEAGIDVAGKGVDRRPLGLLRKAPEALRVELRETVGDVHQRAELLRRHLRRRLRKLQRVFFEDRPGDWNRRHRPLVVQCLGRRDDRDHEAG
jgi:hypothetical protein